MTYRPAAQGTSIPSPNARENSVNSSSREDVTNPMESKSLGKRTLSNDDGRRPNQALSAPAFNSWRNRLISDLLLDNISLCIMPIFPSIMIL